MKKIRIFIFVSALVALLYSCQKEVNLQNSNRGGNNNNNNVSIIGDYDFAGVEFKVRTVSTVASPPLGEMKAIATSNYSSTDNSGTISFTANQMIYTGIAYKASSVYTVQTYLNDFPLGSSNQLMSVDYPPTSGTDNYVKNNADSLTFPNLIFLAGNPYASSIDPKPMGAKISWSGDTLLLKIVHTMTGTVSQGGSPADFTGETDGYLKLKKKP